MNIFKCSGLFGIILVTALSWSSPVTASYWGARQEYREGMREIAQERREMRRDIMNAGSRREAREAYREGMREIRQERREARREIRRELRRHRW
jgi:TRAP-type C4-dicarboxylate transport system substrate-binding protein